MDVPLFGADERLIAFEECRKNKTEGFCIRFIAIPDLLIEYPTSDMVLSFAPHSVDEIITALDGLASAWDWRRHAVPNRF